MRIYFIISFCILFSFPSFSKASLLGRCYTSFLSKTVKYRFSKDKQWQNPYAEKLFSSVYTQIPLLEGKARLSPRELQFFVSRIEQLLDYLESSSSPSVLRRLELMNSHWSSAVQVVPDIISFINSEQAEELDVDINMVLKFIFSTFGHHTLAYLRHPRTNKLDWERLGSILKNISLFSGQERPAFALHMSEQEWKSVVLYKIQMVILSKYSAREYIYCS